MKVTPETNFKLHPQNLYKATYLPSSSTHTTLSITLPKLNYLIKTQDDTNILKYQNLKLLLIPENADISKDDDPQTISPSKIQDCLESQNPNQNPICYLSTTSFTPELFDPQELECHLITFNQNIPTGTYKAVILQPEDNTYKLFEMLPDRADLLPKITITSHYTTPQTTITPSTINTATMKLDTLQKGKITITINSDHFTGKTFSLADGKNKLRRWIEIMKGNEIILPKTEITTTYDENNQKITEVKEDYENNKITITIPEYYLFGYTEKPQQMPQNLTQNTSYTIQVYTTHYASTDTTHKQINLINMPFNLTFYHQDHLSTTRYITNDSGEILHTTDTLAYGEELTAPYENNKDEVLNTITYTGHEKDYETDLTYMLARYYSSETGRFLSPDPGYDYDQLDPMSWNLYAYVRGNPVKKIDPTGKNEWNYAMHFFYSSCKNEKEMIKAHEAIHKGLGKGLKYTAMTATIVAAPEAIPEITAGTSFATSATTVIISEATSAASAALDAASEGKSGVEVAKAAVEGAALGAVTSVIDTSNPLKAAAFGAAVEGGKTFKNTKDINQAAESAIEGGFTYGVAGLYTLPAAGLALPAGEKAAEATAQNGTNIMLGIFGAINYDIAKKEKESASSEVERKKEQEEKNEQKP
ncbi:hypothetical protein TTHT_2013 [Thermotomaculum hydrothermale]|uniref:RHS repeat-associated core domain-containing protein n=1 Tax=Thermotomaculum hydrothermale TaxID=981385 RepID=A0A7R6PYY7_9BACT|nr:RHS repeat-associated core domain-containing protein [Thermotomaculum hydrothermale]BBB33455.1 hypothetical protein TTHT_2013 [Thermotomaculum hydrothermale]